MGLFIKGMEMPVNCCYCPLINYDPDIEWNDGGRETQGAYICVITHELIDNTKREEHCPLIEIPPHGRLIDASEKIRVQIYDDMTEDYHIAEMTIDDLLSQGWVEADAPTIIPADLAEEDKA